MNASNATAGTAAANPQWLPHRYDPGHDAVHFIHVPRDKHRSATFLTDEYLPAQQSVILRRTDALVAAPQPAPIHFILHSAFCCSTLLARAFDIEGTSMGLKEPVLLNDLVGWRHRGGEPAVVARVLDDMLRLLARPFGAGEAVVVKPSNVVNGLATAMLSQRPNARAVLLHAPLRVYLGSVARKGMWGRLWVRDLLAKLLRDRLVDLGFRPDDYFLQTDLQVAGVGWLAQHALFAHLAASMPQRVRTLDSETLVARPIDAIRRTAELFELRIDEGTARQIAAGPAFTSHSKFGGEFDRQARAAEQREGMKVHVEEIDKVACWIEAVAANADVPLDLPNPLLD